MAHYFTNDYVKSNREKIFVNMRGISFSFITDGGVFSKKGLDFGTRSLLENIDLNELSGDVLDFGCGYGPIGIFLKKGKNINVDMIDINERALELALLNAKLNDVSVNIFQSNVYENVSKMYDAIVTNPPIRVGNEVLFKILFGAYDHLRDGGCLWLVINKDQGAKTILKKLSEVYLTDVVCKNKGFYIIRAQKH